MGGRKEVNKEVQSCADFNIPFFSVAKQPGGRGGLAIFAHKPRCGRKAGRKS